MMPTEHVDSLDDEALDRMLHDIVFGDVVDKARGVWELVKAGRVAELNADGGDELLDGGSQ